MLSGDNYAEHLTVTPHLENGKEKARYAFVAKLVQLLRLLSPRLSGDSNEESSLHEAQLHTMCPGHLTAEDGKLLQRPSCTTVPRSPLLISSSPQIIKLTQLRAHINILYPSAPSTNSEPD